MGIERKYLSRGEYDGNVQAIRKASKELQRRMTPMLRSAR